MSSDHKIDEAKGRAKEAAGDLTDDDELKQEGKLDQAASDAKEKVNDVAGNIKEKAEGAVDRVKEHVGSDDDS